MPPPVHGSSIVGKTIKDSRVINETFTCSFINLSTSYTIEEIGKIPFSKIRRYSCIVYRVLKQLINDKPDLCYMAITSKGLAFYKDGLLAILVKLFGVQMVYHFHNKGISTRQENKFDNFLYQMVFKDTHAILLSKYLYPDVEKYFHKSKVYYCPNGIPDASKLRETKEKSNIVELLFLSNLIESKGVFVLLEACSILKNRKIDFHCTYAGDEGNVNIQQFNKKVNELNLNNFVSYVGKKYGKEKEMLFSKSDIFVFPTYYEYETFGIVNLEAMQHYLPVVSTFEGGIPDVIENGKTGFLVKQKDAEALANKLEILITNPELRQQMGKAGRVKYENEFTQEIFENKLLNILTNI